MRPNNSFKPKPLLLGLIQALGVTDPTCAIVNAKTRSQQNVT
jgi:hypothetical protein